MKFDETVKSLFKSHESQQVKVQIEHDKNWLCAIYIQAVPSMLWGFCMSAQVSFHI